MDTTKSREKKENENKGIFSTVKYNILYFLMFVALIASIYYDYFNKEKSISESSLNEQNMNEGNTSQIEEKKIPLTSILIAGSVLIVFIVINVLTSKDFVRDAVKQEASNQKSFTSRITKEEYERSTKETTSRELQKLINDPRYSKMIKEKGTDPINWVWQTKEKEKKTVWRENNNNSDDEDDLSQITLSDD